MQKIYKYRLPVDGQVITIHENVIEFLHVGTQNGYPTVWAVVDDNRRECEIVAWGTGWDLPDEVWLDCEYIGTCEDKYGYVWHYFARFKDPDPRVEMKNCGLAGNGALKSADFTVSLDEDMINRLFGMTTNDFDKITYTNAADQSCATRVSFACT